MSTTTRLLHLLSLLQTHRDWPGAVLADRLGTSGRTVRRDIDRLRDMGYRIQATMGPDGGYRLEAGREVPPLLFDEEQTVALALALHAAPTMGAGIAEAAIRALGTIRQVMPTRLRHRLDIMRATAVARPGDGPAVDTSSAVLVTLAQTIQMRETLRFDYTDAAGIDARQLGARRTEPLHLVTSHGRWYLLGWDLDREDWRLYRVDRIRPRTPNGPRYAPRALPGGDVEAFVSARFKGAESDRWPCSGTVILDLPMREVLPFAGDGSVSAVDEHRCALELGSWSWIALAAAFGRFDAAMEVVHPPELAEAFATLSRRCRETADRAVADPE